MRKSKISIPLLSLAAMLLISGYAFGISSYTSTFNSTYGTAAGTALGANSSANCVLCHPNGNTGQYTSYAEDFRSNNRNFATIEPLDSDGDGFSNIAEINALTLPYDANSRPAAGGDTTLPTVSTFTVPATATTLVVAITALTAADNVGVTGYLVNESATKPTAGNWAATRPTSYAFASPGAKTLYAWARDAAGNVSNSLSRTVTITLPPTADTTLPTISGFTVPATATTLVVAITALTAADNVGVTGYLVNESATKPTAGNWAATRPTSYTFASPGAKTLYAWARDAAGNVSSSRSASVTITLPPTADSTLPTVSGFTVAATAGSLTVSITTFSATDNVGVTGYLVNESSTKPLATATGWNAAVPTGYTFAGAGAKTLYAWAKDNANNVSDSVSRTVTVTTGSGGGGGEADVESPEVMEFTLPLTSTSLTVPIVAFRAIDNVAPTAYLITTTSTAPTANATGWRTTPPTSYTFTSTGAKTLYGWVKDGAGNVSESVWDNVDIAATTTSDRTLPVVTGFRISSSSESLRVRITSFTATDNVRVTGYLVTATATKPGASASGWRSTPPTSYSFTSGGTKRLYPWVKDAAGNVSASFSGNATVNISPEEDDETDDEYRRSRD